MRDQIEILLTQSNRELDETWSPREAFLPSTDVWKAEWQDYETNRHELSDWAQIGAAYLNGELEYGTMLFVQENLPDWVASLHATSGQRTQLAETVTDQAERAQNEATDNLLEAGRQLQEANLRLTTALDEIKEVEAHSDEMVGTVNLLLDLKTYAEYTQNVAGIANSVQLEQTLKAGGQLTALALSHIMPSKSFNHETVAGSVTGSIRENIAEIGGKLAESGTQAVLVSMGVASLGELYSSVRAAHDNVRASAGKYEKAIEAQKHSENVIAHSADVQDAIDDTVHLQDQVEAEPAQQDAEPTQVDTDGDGAPDMTEASPALQQELNPLILDVIEPEAGAQTGTLAPVSPTTHFGDAGMSMLGDAADPVPDQGFSSQLTDAPLDNGLQDHDPGAEPDAGMCLSSDLGGINDSNFDPFADQSSQLGQVAAGGQDDVATHGLDGSDPTSNPMQSHAADGAGQSDVAPSDGGVDASAQADVVVPPAGG